MNAESPSVSIVLLGKFQPNNFLPDRLVDARVIPRKLAESVSYITLIPGHQVHYKFDWGELLVTQKRLQILTREAPYVRICDFVLKVLGDVAPESRVTAFGINRDGHYDLGSMEARNRLGMRLAPPDAWGAWGDKVRDSIEGEDQGTPLQGGVVLLQMRLPFSDDGISGLLDVTVMPSQLIPNERGVMFRTNHHHQLSESVLENNAIVVEKLSAKDMTSKLLEILLSRFDSSIANSESIFQGVLTP